MTTDETVRRRLREVLSGAGVGHSRIAIEVLYLLPKDFVLKYEELFHKALRDPNEGIGARQAAAGELGKAPGKALKNTPQRAGWLVKDARALAEKERIDRQLRKLARSMSGERLEGSTERCGWFRHDLREKAEAGGEGDGKVGCGKFVESGWAYCPACGLGQAEPEERVRGRGRGRRR